MNKPRKKTITPRKLTATGQPETAVKAKAKLPNIEEFLEQVIVKSDAPLKPISPIEDPEAWEWLQWQRQLLVGFDDFLEQDKPGRQQILPDVQKALEKWFTHGVDYTKHWLAPIIPFPEYTRMPKELDTVLEAAQGQIVINILRWKQIPLRLCPELLMSTSALPLRNKRELKATFGSRDMHPAIKPVYDTEGMTPSERAEIIANNWYHLAARDSFMYITLSYNKLTSDGSRAASIKAVERQLEREQRLRDMNLDVVDIIEFYACELGYEYLEVSEMSRALGRIRSSEAIRKHYNKLKDSLGEKKKRA